MVYRLNFSWFEPSWSDLTPCALRSGGGPDAPQMTQLFFPSVACVVAAVRRFPRQLLRPSLRRQGQGQRRAEGREGRGRREGEFGCRVGVDEDRSWCWGGGTGPPLGAGARWGRGFGKQGDGKARGLVYGNRGTGGRQRLGSRTGSHTGSKGVLEPVYCPVQDARGP